MRDTVLKAFRRESDFRRKRDLEPFLAGHRRFIVWNLSCTDHSDTQQRNRSFLSKPPYPVKLHPLPPTPHTTHEWDPGSPFATPLQHAAEDGRPRTVGGEDGKKSGRPDGDLKYPHLKHLSNMRIKTLNRFSCRVQYYERCGKNFVLRRQLLNNDKRFTFLMRL